MTVLKYILASGALLIMGSFCVYLVWSCYDMTLLVIGYRKAMRDLEESERRCKEERDNRNDRQRNTRRNRCRT